MLHVNSLKGKVNAKAVEDALAEVESGGSSLIKAYDKTMRMIQRQDEGYRTLAKHTLSWLAFSDEPLTTSQLQHALAIEPGKTDLDFNNVTNLEIILSSCAGLVTVQENYNACSTVHMVHKTTQEYFLETRLEWFGDVRARLARLSLTYLTFQTFGTGPYRADLASRQEKYPLWIYLSRYFSRYIEGKSDSEDARVKSMLGKFFLGDAYVVAHVQARPELFDTNNWKYLSLRSTFNSLETWRPHLFARRGFAEGSTALHLAIFYRFGSLIPMLIHKGANKTDSYGLTPLHLAVVLKFYEGIQYLLSAPEVDCNVAAPGREWTALLHACKEGDERSVRLLLACEKTDCNLPDEHGVTPLMWALSYRRSEVVRLLLGREDVEFISPDEDGLLPLHHAALGGSTDCIRELLGKHNLGVNLVDSKGRTPLAWCMEHSCSQATLQLISRNDVVIRWPIKTGQIRLAWIMEALLVRFRSEISAKDNNHRTVLDHAAQHGHWDIVQQLLVRCKPKLCIECSFEDTALFFAARGGPPEVVELLVSQIELKDSSWFMRALVLSMESKTLECFAIMEKKLQGWMQCHPEWMEACLVRAAEKGRDNVLASILQRLRHDISGIDVGEVHFLDDQFSWDNVTIPEIVFDIPSTQLNVRDKLGQTALHAMARHQNIAATRILLIMGAETDARDDDGCTAVECASHWPEDLEWLRERMLPS
jgi:ankyrin repeat protein